MDYAIVAFFVACRICEIPWPETAKLGGQMYAVAMRSKTRSQILAEMPKDLSEVLDIVECHPDGQFAVTQELFHGAYIALSDIARVTQSGNEEELEWLQQATDFHKKAYEVWNRLPEHLQESFRNRFDRRRRQVSSSL